MCRGPDQRRESMVGDQWHLKLLTLLTSGDRGWLRGTRSSPGRASTEGKKRRSRTGGTLNYLDLGATSLDRGTRARSLTIVPDLSCFKSRPTSAVASEGRGSHPSHATWTGDRGWLRGTRSSPGRASIEGKKHQSGIGGTYKQSLGQFKRSRQQRLVTHHDVRFILSLLNRFLDH